MPSGFQVQAGETKSFNLIDCVVKERRQPQTRFI
jgi:hypothetical protein